MKTPSNLVGKKFNRLTVLEFSYVRGGNSYWLCHCECGNEKIIQGSHLKSGDTQSCGCLIKEVNKEHFFKDISGFRFGKLVVLNYSHIENRRIYWLCRCDCGIEKTINGDNLRRGNTQSCGCSKKQYLSIKMSGKNNPKWRDGSSKLEYSDDWNEVLREQIRNRDNRKCQYLDCQYDDTKEKRKLSVHHIDSDKRNCQEYNLISLCNKHHQNVEIEPELWQDYFYQITNDYLIER